MLSRTNLSLIDMDRRTLGCLLLIHHNKSVYQHWCFIQTAITLPILEPNKVDFK